MSPTGDTQKRQKIAQRDTLWQELHGRGKGAKVPGAKGAKGLVPVLECARELPIVQEARGKTGVPCAAAGDLSGLLCH